MMLTVPDWSFLQEALAEGIACKIEGFSGDFRFLSNFWPAPLEMDGIIFPTVEHAYQAAKTSQRRERQRIADLLTPGQAKQAGAKLELRPDWDAVKQEVMVRLVRLKFTTHLELRAKLLATGDCYLEETNTWGDRYWGVSAGSGANHLGRILMRIREELRS